MTDRPGCRAPAACEARGDGLCRRCSRIREAAAMRADPAKAAARAERIGAASRTPERRAKARAALAATSADPAAAARRADAAAWSTRAAERRAASRALIEAVNADPAVRPAIVANGRARVARMAGARRTAAAARLAIPVEWVAEVRKLRGEGMTEREAVDVLADRAARAERRRAERWAFSPLERGAYGVVMVDPPWQFQTRGAPGDRAVPYGTMTLRDVMDLPVRELAADDCWLWLWGLAEMVPHAMAVLDAWSFNPVTSGTWVKTTASGGLCFGKGYVLRNSEEPYFLARRGRPPVASHGVRNTILAPRRENSRKPDEAYANAERLFGPARRADVFARESRPGWDGWGHEATKFDAP